MAGRGPLNGGEADFQGVTVKLVALVAVPPAVRLPVEASAGTTTVIFVAMTVAGTAPTPLKRTLVAPPKALPLIVTVAPTAAAVGVNEVTRGSTDSAAALVAVPPAVVSEIVPELAAAGTVSRTWSVDRTLKLAATPFTFTEATPPKPVPP